MVLAIGNLFDDAIVVVAIERIMREHLPPKEATANPWTRSSALWWASPWSCPRCSFPWPFSAVRSASFTGNFSITIVAAMALSVLVAMILTPALCATLLKPHEENPKAQQGFFGKFNRWFDKVSYNYQKTVHGMLLKPVRYLIIYGLAVGLMGFLFLRLPSSFLPDEDQGLMFAMVQLPPASTMERTIEVLKKMEQQLS